MINSNTTNMRVPGSALATYGAIYAWTSVIAGTLGVLLNVLNVYVLLQREMRSAVNTVLTAIAYCDIGCLLSSVIFNIREKIQYFACDSERYTYAWALYQSFFAGFAVTARAMSLWFSVSVAALRMYILLRPITGAPLAMNINVSLRLIALTAIWVIIAATPIYYTASFIDCQIDPCNNQIECSVNMSAVGNSTMYGAAMWVQGGAFKLAPCCLIAILLLVIIALLARRAQPGLSSLRKDRTERHQLATRILVVILLVTVFCELPQAIVHLMVDSGALSPELYLKIGDTLDMLSMIQFLTCFTLYCSSNQRYRQIVRSIFWTKARAARNCRCTTRGETTLAFGPALRADFEDDQLRADQGVESVAYTRDLHNHLHTGSVTVVPISSASFLGAEV